MSTRLCQEYLVKNFASWADAQYGEDDDLIEGSFTAQIRANNKKVIKNSRKPSGWARVAKYTVGSKTDVEGTDQPRTGANLARDFPKLKGWTCRVFLLKDSDSIEIALFEKDGVVSTEYYDFSD